MKPKYQHQSTLKIFSWDILILFIIYISLYLVLTLLHPFPDGISDSADYIRSAVQGRYIGYRPYGYSKFLNLIKGVSNQIPFLIFIQFLISTCVHIVFAKTLVHIFNLSKGYKIALYILLAFSLKTIYLTNCILSDSLFTSLTILWTTILIWIIYSKDSRITIVLIILTCIVLYITINIRYIGIIYFILTFFVLTLTLCKKEKNLFFLSFLILCIMGYKLYHDQVMATKKITGVHTYSGFSGWQMADNAMHAVSEIDFNNDEIENPELKNFISTLSNFDSSTLKADGVTAKYLWLKKLPLKQYLFDKMNENQSQYLRTWTKLGKTTYTDFAKYVMIHYPVEYTQNYLIPNLLETLYPKLDDLYTTSDTAYVSNVILKDHFDFDPSLKMLVRQTPINAVANYLPITQLIIWLVLMVILILIIAKKVWKKLTKIQTVIFGFIWSVMAGYILFHIYAAPVYMRHLTPIYFAQTSLIIVGFSTLIMPKHTDDLPNTIP